jgi:hypothetical protein
MDSLIDTAAFTTEKKGKSKVRVYGKTVYDTD